MKWGSLQPTEGAFNFAAADAQVAFAKARGLAVRGHPQVWHPHNPARGFNEPARAPQTPSGWSGSVLTMVPSSVE